MESKGHENAYYLSHNGLGDNVLNNGAVYFLSQYYHTVYFLCNDIFTMQVQNMFTDTNIVVVPIDTHNEYKICRKFLMDKYSSNDIYISGVHKSYLLSQITNPHVLQYVPTKKYTIPKHFQFGLNFYQDNGLDSSIMMDYFTMPMNHVYQKLYEDISMFQIYFIHTESSQSTIDLSKWVTPFLKDDQNLIISPNRNYYDPTSDKYELAEKYIRLPSIFHYTHILLHAKEIHIIDSCISCLLLCLQKRLSSNNTLYDRFTSKKIDLS